MRRNHKHHRMRRRQRSRSAANPVTRAHAPAISKAGQSAEQRFCEITGAERAPRARGDALLGEHVVEIKKTSGKYLNLNQVRAHKYLPLVVYHEDAEDWYVIPAHQVVDAVSTRVAQHCCNPFECARLSLHGFVEYRVTNPSVNLKAHTLAAIREAARYPELDAHMQSLSREIADLVAQARVEVQAILCSDRLGLVESSPGLGPDQEVGRAS